jgi:hypothetical protein
MKHKIKNWNKAIWLELCVKKPRRETFRFFGCGELVTNSQSRTIPTLAINKPLKVMLMNGNAAQIV